MAINGLEKLDCFGEPVQPAPFPTLAGPEDIGCNGICLTPADIGLPEYGGVAYAHPDCPEHGDRLDNEEDTTYAAFPVDDPLDT